MEHHKTNEIVFLGFCDRAAYVREGNTNVFKWNILGLKTILLSHIFPLSLSGLTFGFAFLSTISGEQNFKITDENGEEVGTITINFLDKREGTPEVSEAVLRQKGPWLMVSEHGWTITFLPLKINIIITKPGIYYLSQITDEESKIVGQILFAVVNPPALTAERIAAIRSDPNAAKHVGIEIGCKECPSKIRAYASLERAKKMEDEGWNWYETIPNEFICSCGSTKIDLTFVRRNLHGLLGSRMRTSEELNFIPLYEKSSIERIRSDFLHLINSDPKEEILQQFLEENPILLHQFPSEKLFSKPSILTFFVADFTIVTPQKELVLIELEKTTTRLMKKNGGTGAPLSHAFDQVRGWLHIVDEHRLAVLDSLKIERELVSVVRGVVIAGRDVGYDAKHPRQLKGADWGRITLLTYDDLLFALDALIRGMEIL